MANLGYRLRKVGRDLETEFLKTNPVQQPKMANSGVRRKIFSLQQSAAPGVLKRRNVPFLADHSRLKMRRIATPIFGRPSTSALLQNLVKSLLQCEKTGYKMRSSTRSKRHGFDAFDRPWGPTFSPCFSDAGTNNGVEESLSNYSIKDLARSRIAFRRRNTPGTLCCVVRSAVTRDSRRDCGSCQYT